MTMNMIETIDEVAALPGQLDDHGKTAGAASMRIKVQLIDPHRSDAMVAWTTNAPFWQGAVMTAIRKLGMEAALTGAARAEVERCLERDTRRQNTGSGSIRIFGA